MISIEVNQRVGIIATSGAGKSTAAYTLLEDLRNRKYPVCILDVKNEYGGLPKTSVIYASQTKADKLVHALKKTNASCVVFMKDFSIEKKKKWIGKFLKECHKISRDVPIMIAIEEIRLFAPQQKNPLSKEPIADLAQGGRSEGYGCLLISQRSADIDKSILGSLTDLFIMQHILNQDQEYCKKFIGKERAAQLPYLKKGQALHVDFQNSNITEVQFPNNPRKKGGQTIAPIAVEPAPLDLTNKKEKATGNGKWIIIGGIIAMITIIAIIFIVIYFYINKDRDEMG